MKNYKHLKVDLSNCDEEPIHLIGRIQAHGYLLVLDPGGWVIRQVSGNIERLTGFSVAACLNRPLAEVFGPQACRAITPCLEAGAPDDAVPLVIGEQSLFCFTHHAGNSVVLEFEPAPHHTAATLHRLNSFLSKAIGGLSRQETLREMAAFTVGQIQALLGYDRVMVYQFDQDWHGNVVAEKVKPGVKSYYNHHFPAGDFPARARALLLTKGIRQVADVSTEGIEIVPYFNPATGQPTDVSACEGRNPSEIHLEYLKNMEVEATLTIAIAVEGRLWGLVLCHHHVPVFVDYPARNTAWLITRYFAASILSARESDHKDLRERYARAEKRLLAQMEENLNITGGLSAGPVTLLDLSKATGAAIVLDNRLVTLGECPEESAIREIIGWAAGQQLPGVFTTRELYKHHPAAAAFKEVASGLMLIEVSKHNQEYILCFKPEMKEKISWAGNPEEAGPEDAGKKLHPRRSFHKWEQEIEGKSSPWTALEEERANALSKAVASIHLRCQAEKLRELNGQLEEALHQLRVKNAQMEDFARIASHNLFAPLNNIRGLLQHYQSEPDFDTAQVVLEDIHAVSDNMRQTLVDLHQILEISAGAELQKDCLDIGRIIDKEKKSLAVQIQDAGAVVGTDLGAGLIVYPKIYLESIIHNLLSNALKYRSPARKPEITITTREESTWVVLQVTDNGLGINLEKHGAKVFGLYKTFHRKEDSRGLGLYLVKKQVEALGGTIGVESREGEGTRFTVRLKKFPVEA